MKERECCSVEINQLLTKFNTRYHGTTREREREGERQTEYVPANCCFIRGYCSQGEQVTLVSNEHDDDVSVSVVPQLLQPSLHTLVSHVLGYVVHEESTNCPTIIPIQREKERDRLRGTVREMKEREKEDLR